MITTSQLKLFTIWVIIIVLVYIVFKYLDNDSTSRSDFYNITRQGDYYVFNTNDDMTMINKNIKGSINIVRPDLYLKLQGKPQFNIDNYFQKYFDIFEKLRKSLKKQIYFN